MIVIGCDPDAARHGIAVYKSGKLIELHNFELFDL